MAVLNGGMKLIVFQAVYEQQPVIIRDLMKFLEHPPFAGSYTIHSVNGQIAFAERRETVKD
jgi:hypothetical protein